MSSIENQIVRDLECKVIKACKYKDRYSVLCRFLKPTLKSTIHLVFAYD